MDPIAVLTSAFEAIKNFFSSIFCFLYNFFANPLNYLAYIVNGLVDGIAAVFPSTPANLKLPNLIQTIGSAIPFLGAGGLSEILYGIAGVMFIYAVIKAIKYIPFI